MFYETGIKKRKNFATKKKKRVKPNKRYFLDYPFKQNQSMYVKKTRSVITSSHH